MFGRPGFNSLIVDQRLEKLICTASLFDIQQDKIKIKECGNKPASSLVISLRKALNRIASIF